MAGCLVLFSGILVSTLTYSHLRAQMETRLQQDAQRQLQRLTIAIAPSLLKQDRISLNLTLSEWNTGPEITAIQVLNINQQVIAESGRQDTGLLELSQPVNQDNTAAGLLRARLDLSSAGQSARHYLALGLIASGLSALLCALLCYQLAERGMRYLRQLTVSLSNWQNNDKPLQLPPVPRIQEFTTIHRELNKVSQREQHQRAMEEALGRFVYGQVAEPNRLLRYHECALLFIEIQDLEILQSRLSADELSQALNQYHRLLSHAAKLYNGKLDRYIGDSVVMMFGIGRPGGGSHEALHCLYAAQLFLGLVSHLQEHDSKLTPVEFRIAAHWGNVLLAPITHDEKTECSLIGDTVHWASHLAGSSEENRLLVSQELVDHLPGDNAIQWEEGPVVSDLHGREQTSYWLTQLPEKNHSLIQRQIKHITAMTENV
ncbi:adenylate/guanylate cyclase domain-containing protein [Thalassolituus sp. LLYu03]|uniref:adenylate/guanylate cyclase domain-containing protein n=1 Tax=Thalassolituus sp. LLYu03 TaxID=3421656 RepID=UPI003D26FD84